MWQVTTTGHAASSGYHLPSPADVAEGFRHLWQNGQILQPGSFAQVPSYWQQAAAFMASHAKDQTTLVVPADAHGIYTWGQPIDEPLEPLASSPWTEDSLVPERTLSFVLSRHIEGGMHEDLDITNYGRERVRFNLEVMVRCDFSDVFDVKSKRDVRRGHISSSWEDGQTLPTTYRNKDFVRAVKIVRGEGPPDAETPPEPLRTGPRLPVK